MNGRIYGINRSRRLAAIETKFHGYTVIELLKIADVEVGDEISWDSDTSMGAQTYSNLSTRHLIEVIVHNHLVSKSSLRLLMG